MWAPYQCMDIKDLTYLINLFLTSSHLSAQSWLHKIWPTYYIFSGCFSFSPKWTKSHSIGLWQYYM